MRRFQQAATFASTHITTVSLHSPSLRSYRQAAFHSLFRNRTICLPIKNGLFSVPSRTRIHALQLFFVFHFHPSPFTQVQQAVVNHWIRYEGNGHFSLHYPVIANPPTPLS